MLIIGIRKSESIKVLPTISFGVLRSNLITRNGQKNVHKRTREGDIRTWEGDIGMSWIRVDDKNIHFLQELHKMRNKEGKEHE